MTEDEKRKLRAERFGIPVVEAAPEGGYVAGSSRGVHCCLPVASLHGRHTRAELGDDKKRARAARFGLPVRAAPRAEEPAFVLPPSDSVCHPAPCDAGRCG